MRRKSDLRRYLNRCYYISLLRMMVVCCAIGAFFFLLGIYFWQEIFIEEINTEQKQQMENIQRQTAEMRRLGIVKGARTQKQSADNTQNNQ